MTKQNFMLKLRETAFENKKIIFFDSVFNLLILFLVFVILFRWIGFDYAIIAAVILSIIISIILFWKKTKSYDVLEKISQKYPDFEESLETAYDNKDRSSGDNIIIRSLMTDASSEMDSVDTAAFFNKRQITLKVFLIIFLSFSLLFFTLVQESTAITDILNEGYGYGDSTSKNESDQKKTEETEDEREAA